MTDPHLLAGWFEFWVRFVCGALLGVLVWDSVFRFPSLASWDGWLALGGCGVLFGSLAGWFGDRFWHAFLRWWMW